MKQEDDRERYRNVLKEMLPQKIDKNFITKYFSAFNQAKLGSKLLPEYGLEDSLLMNGLAGLDCSDIEFDDDVSQEFFELIPFDSETIFSDAIIEKFHPEQILESGKEFGLGLDELGLTGKGIHIAITDENCNPYYTDANIVDYTRVKRGQIFKEVDYEDEEHMHGLITTSLLASRSCGVAKDASVHFFTGRIRDTNKKEVYGFVDYIVEHNQRCIEEHRESEIILVASRSARDDKFLEHRDLLRKYGCELVCANNFNPNFCEFIGSNQMPAMDLSESEIDKCIELIQERKKVD